MDRGSYIHMYPNARPIKTEMRANEKASAGALSIFTVLWKQKTCFWYSAVYCLFKNKYPRYWDFVLNLTSLKKHLPSLFGTSSKYFQNDFPVLPFFKLLWALNFHLKYVNEQLLEKAWKLSVDVAYVRSQGGFCSFKNKPPQLSLLLLTATEFFMSATAEVNSLK